MCVCSPETIPSDMQVDLETPNKPQTAVKNRKSLKILMMKSMNMFTPAKAITTNTATTSSNLPADNNYGRRYATYTCMYVCAYDRAQLYIWCRNTVCMYVCIVV